MRQVRVEGTAVTETRVRVPRGDVVQHVYTVADAGGLTVVEVTNESTLPVAIAFGRRDVLTERPIVDVPIEGIELPAGVVRAAARPSGVVPHRHPARGHRCERAVARRAGARGAGGARVARRSPIGRAGSRCPTVSSAPRSPHR